MFFQVFGPLVELPGTWSGRSARPELVSLRPGESDVPLRKVAMSVEAPSAQQHLLQQIAAMREEGQLVDRR